MKTALHYLTTFPGILDAYFQYSIPGKSISKEIVSYQIHNIRDYTHDLHRTTDDSPFGGGPGMVMKMEPIVEALEKGKKYKVWTYDGSGNLIERYNYSGGGVTIEKWKYDTNNNLIENNYQGSLLSSGSPYKYEYGSFDRNGNWLSHVIYNNGKLYKTIHREIQYYDE